MPYVDQKGTRSGSSNYAFKEGLADARLLVHQFVDNGGDLNAMFTAMIDEYMHKHGVRYQQMQDVMGCLEGVKGEFYRRVYFPYENLKIKENGDIYTVAIASVTRPKSEGR